MSKPNGIEKRLDIEPREFKIEPLEIHNENIIKDYEFDYNFVRVKLLNSIHKADKILDRALELAESDIHPRVIDATSSLLRTMSENSKDLMSMHKEMINMKEKFGVLEKELAKSLGKEYHDNTDKDGNKVVKTNIKDIIAANKEKELG